MGEHGLAVVAAGRNVWLCPGQGAQTVGMGKDLATRFPAARLTFEAIDDALGFGLSQVMFEGPEDALTATSNAQPAILAHSAAIFAVIGTAVSVAAAAAGHSLGEYSAYVTAGALTPRDAATLVRQRGELMERAGRDRPGAMAAVLGLPAADVATACHEASAKGAIAVAANLNTPDQTVISGDPDAVKKAGDACKARGAKRVIELKVSGAFHSPLMAPAANRLRVVLDKASFGEPRFPVIANATAEAVTTAARARRLLVDQLTGPVRWVECIENAVRIAGEGGRFIEIGPGNTLAGLVKRIAPETNVVSVATADQLAQFLETA
jgi:[acyl-carrier-protein] S-malonyltransferase